MLSVQNVSGNTPQTTALQPVNCKTNVMPRTNFKSNNDKFDYSLLYPEEKKKKKITSNDIVKWASLATTLLFGTVLFISLKDRKMQKKYMEQSMKEINNAEKIESAIKKASEKLANSSPEEKEALLKSFKANLENGNLYQAIIECPNKELQIAAKNEMEKGPLASQTRIKNILSLANLENMKATEVDLSNACKLMDEKLIGMDEVKREMLDFLVEYNYCLRNGIKRKKPFVLCLDGPPGTGKTTASEVLAEAMGMKYKKISLAGANGKGPIKGYESVYTGASSGGIAQGQLDNESTRILYCLDEAEKTATSDQHGKVEDCLLSLFDDQAKFVDDYLDAPIDLSQSVFILTTNEFEKLSEPLKNRVRKIEIKPYDNKIKAQIAKLKLKNALKHFKLAEKVSIKDEIYEEIAKRTNDGGGRETTQNVDTLIKKIINKFGMSQNMETLTLDKEFVTKSLSNNEHFDILAYLRGLIGASNK